jgi:dipeptidyl aminopeptidase/acylaminoacyl peptidase
MKWLRLVPVLLVGAGLVAVGSAQLRPGGANRLTIEDTLRWRIASNPVLSPDARRIAYLVTENDFEKSRPVTHLWWVDTETRQARRLTQTDNGASDPRWSPDGRWLAFLSTRGSDDPRKLRAQVWLLPVEGGESFALTRASSAAADVLHYRWAPDGKAVYFVAPQPLPTPAEAFREQRQKQRMDAVVVDEEKPRKEIWRVALEDRRAERIFAGDLGLDEFEVSPDGKWIVYRTNYTGEPDHSRKYDLWLLELATGRARQLTRRDGEERSAVWSPDSARVAFLAPRVPEINYSQEEVFVVPIAPPAPAVAGEAQPPEPQRVTKDFAGAIERLQWPARGDAIWFAAGLRTGNQLFQLNPADGTVRPANAENVFLTDADGNGESVAAVVEGPNSLPEIALLRLGATPSEPQRLTDLNPQLKEFAVGAQEVVRWKSKDALEIEGLLIKPAGWQPGQKYPLLVEIHGGPHARRTNTLASGGFAQVWAARGWLVFQPNFRGSSAYGHEFGIANRGDLGGRDADDILTGVDFLVAQGWADESRLAVAGGSYGGYMTNWLIARTKRFRAAVSLFGIFNLVTDFSNSDFPSWERDYLTKYYWENLQIYLDRSPFKYVNEITTPVLILHGEEDNNTAIANSREMYQALKTLGRTAKFVRFPREGHGFREPNHHIEQFRLMAAWLDAHALGITDTRARQVGEAARKDNWELRVTAVRMPQSYAGVKPKGQFIEVELLIRALEPTEERFSLLVFDTSGSEIVLATEDRNLYPEGVVAEALGQRVLVKSSGQVVAFVPDRQGGHSAMAVAVAFDAPLGAREFTLRVKEFPPIRIELPLAEGSVR